MLADLPDSPLDFSVLSKRIAEVKDANATMSQKQLAKAFIINTILPILNTKDIYQMLQNPVFVEQFSDLLVGFLVTAPKVAPKANEL
ncbi:hypothetical protein Pam2_117 [Pseudanabaena phage Pam2]|nr:hypothetical protein Pam2_117 [Pseudanabaena phage Pam2]